MWHHVVHNPRALLVVAELDELLAQIVAKRIYSHQMSSGTRTFANNAW
jgi:hypothetical protein